MGLRKEVYEESGADPFAAVEGLFEHVNSRDLTIAFKSFLAELAAKNFRNLSTRELRHAFALILYNSDADLLHEILEGLDEALTPVDDGHLSEYVPREARAIDELVRPMVEAEMEAREQETRENLGR